MAEFYPKVLNYTDEFEVLSFESDTLTKEDVEEIVNSDDFFKKYDQILDLYAFEGDGRVYDKGIDIECDVNGQPVYLDGTIDVDVDVKTTHWELPYPDSEAEFLGSDFWFTADRVEIYDNEGEVCGTFTLKNVHGKHISR